MGQLFYCQCKADKVEYFMTPQNNIRPFSYETAT